MSVTRPPVRNRIPAAHSPARHKNWLMAHTDSLAGLAAPALPAPETG